MTTMNDLPHVTTLVGFLNQREVLARKLYYSPTFNRGEVHAQKVVDPHMHTKEITRVNASYSVPRGTKDWQKIVMPNLPWAEDHFLERVSGEPLNPPPAEAWWPYNRNKNAEHKDANEKFSHTYPERFWPKKANPEGLEDLDQTHHWGIRYRYGDLNDLVEVLNKNPRSRQAYLPVWFPEDLAAASEGQRVPCTLGYHFMQNSRGQLDCWYPMRSCDFLRFMVDDIYMAGRLLQWVAQKTDQVAGTLSISISSLHVFKGDEMTLAKMIAEEDDDDFYLGGVSG